MKFPLVIHRWVVTGRTIASWIDSCLLLASVYSPTGTSASRVSFPPGQGTVCVGEGANFLSFPVRRATWKRRAGQGSRGSGEPGGSQGTRRGASQSYWGTGTSIAQ